jgi:Rod binding domain-containing protein
MLAPLEPITAPASRTLPTPATQDKPDLATVAREFESIFVSMLLKQMRGTLTEGMFAGDASDIYGGIFDEHMGRALADSGFLDLAGHLNQLD